MMKKTKLLVGLLLLTAATALGQGFSYHDIVLNASGTPLPGVTIRVCTEPAIGTPCSNLAQIYSDPVLGSPLANPFTADSLGNYTFYGVPGVYHVQISGTGVSGTRDLANVALSGAQVQVVNAGWFAPVVGPDVIAQIQAAHDYCPSAGCIIEAAFQGAQVASSSSLTITKPVRLNLGPFQVTMGGCLTISTDGVELYGSDSQFSGRGTELTFPASCTNAAIYLNRPGGGQHVVIHGIKIVMNAATVYGIRAIAPWAMDLQHITIYGANAAGQVGVSWETAAGAGSAIYNRASQLNVSAVDVGLQFFGNGDNGGKVVSGNRVADSSFTVNVVGIYVRGTPGGDISTHNIIEDVNTEVVAANGIGVRIDGNSQMNKIIGGLFEQAGVIAGSVGIQMDTGSSGTAILAASVSNNAIPIVESSNTLDNIIITDTTGLTPMKAQFDKIYPGPIGSLGFLSGDANTLRIRAGGANTFNGSIEDSSGGLAAQWSNTGWLISKKLYLTGSLTSYLDASNGNSLNIQAAGANTYHGNLLDKNGTAQLSWSASNILINNGVNADGGGMKHSNVTTGTIGATTRGSVTLTWATPFADNNYDVTCSVIDTSTAAASAGMVLERINAKSSAAVSATIFNGAGVGVVGTLQCTAVHN